MWADSKYDGDMNSSPLPIARPWTPPDEAEEQSSPRSDYFSDPHRSLISIDDLENHWPLSPDNPVTPGEMPAKPDTPPTLSRTRPKPISSVTEPHTPSKPFGDATSHHDALRYPYTPDSARTTRTNTMPVLSPLAPMPWDADRHTPTSPVQYALSSCMSHLENLIQTQQPNDDQMEYIIAQFEAMTSYLSAPEAQSRQSDDHLFPELDVPLSGTGLGITARKELDTPKHEEETKAEGPSEEYVAEVSKYIEGVRRYTEDLRMRMDEVKQLNGIQLDIINDLRKELRDLHLKLEIEIQKEADSEDKSTEGLEKPETPKETTVSVKEPKESPFWAAFGDALDAFGDMCYNY